MIDPRNYLSPTGTHGIPGPMVDPHNYISPRGPHMIDPRKYMSPQGPPVMDSRNYMSPQQQTQREKLALERQHMEREHMQRQIMEHQHQHHMPAPPALLPPAPQRLQRMPEPMRDFGMPPSLPPSLYMPPQQSDSDPSSGEHPRQNMRPKAQRSAPQPQMRANVYGTPYEYGTPLSNYDMFQTMAAQVLLRESCSLADTRVYMRARAHTLTHTQARAHEAMCTH